MQDDHAERADRPTVPSLRPYDDGDGAGERDMVGGMPTWPVASRGGADARADRSGAPAHVLPLALAASVGLNVALLVGLLGVLFLARAGAFTASSGSSGGPPNTAGSPTSTALSTPSPTTPLASGWLQVTPNSVQLGCDGDQQTQTVVLTNTGSHRVQWQAVVAVPTDQAGIEVSPNQGGLKAGASVEIQVRNTSTSTSQQGVIRFEPGSSDAGTPPSLSYTTQSCG